MTSIMTTSHTHIVVDYEPEIDNEGVSLRLFSSLSAIQPVSL